MQGLECQRKTAFKSPPKEWIEHRLDNLYETLNKNTKTSALVLKDLLGAIDMNPVFGECIIENDQLIQNRAYYVAISNIDTLALIDESKGSNSLRCRTREGPIRTISLIPVKIKITINESVPLYQKLAPKIRQMKVLGMNNKEIAAKLQINRKTVWKATLDD